MITKAFELDTKTLKTVPPEILDEHHVLAHFYERIAELARGTANDHVRIGMYGDSNMTMDYLSGEIRRVFQKRFGDGGHGFVTAAKHLAQARPLGDAGDTPARP